MKSATLIVALGVLALSSSIGFAQEGNERMATPPPPPPGPYTLKCCTCVNGASVVPPPLDISTGPGPWGWTVTPGGPQAHATSPYPGWVTLPPASWVQSVNSGTPTPVGPGPYHYAMSFTIPNCPTKFASIQLSGTYAADNGAVVTMGTNTSTCSGAHAYPNCFKAPGMPLNFPVSTGPGPQTLKVDVKNMSSVSGLIVNAKVTARCPVCPNGYVPNLPMQGGNETTACPALTVYTRAQVLALPLTAYPQIMLPNLDQRCAGISPGWKLQQIKFTKCAPDARGKGFGPNATADLTCG